ncbi:hypothetical protein B296_00039113 [Ensete ventricosum]|uniref:VQ domain-containing protein n=1 Tax=Ensete ventricosum TaxID=4639 RepID=A0A426YSE1_ENSVE|nr:hypothetical protein B296_00039113 [Ensete ventricosum]
MLPRTHGSNCGPPTAETSKSDGQDFTSVVRWPQCLLPYLYMSTPNLRCHPFPHVTMSDATTAGPAQWAQLGGRPHLRPLPAPPAPATSAFGCVSDSVVVSTTSSPTTDGSAKDASQQPGIEGRVGKPVRRRSRASRRAPTTMVNTDAANFRMMVQHFTRNPTGPCAVGYHPGGGPVSNVSNDSGERVHQTTALMSFGNRQQHPDQRQNHQPQQQQNYQSPDHSIFTATGGGNNSSDGFLQGFSSSGANLEVDDHFFFDGMYEQMMARPASSNRRAGHFS